MKGISRGMIIVFAVLFSVISQTSFAGYRSELRHATKRGSIYDTQTWDAKVLWHATLFTDDYRHSLEEKHVKLHRLEPLQASRWIAEQEENQAAGWEFFVSLYTKSDYKKLDQTADTFWHLKLTNDRGESVEPTLIESAPVTPYYRLLYPQLTRWSKAYRVVFPKIELANRATLSLWSVVGESTVKWRVGE